MNSNVSGYKNMELLCKELFYVYRIGVVLFKFVKLKNLGFMLRKYKDKIVLLKCLIILI